jgi:hypothetical protein
VDDGGLKGMTLGSAGDASGEEGSNSIYDRFCCGSCCHYRLEQWPSNDLRVRSSNVPLDQGIAKHGRTIRNGVSSIAVVIEIITISCQSDRRLTDAGSRCMSLDDKEIGMQLKYVMLYACS